MVVSETYVKYHLPLRCYRGLLQVYRRTYHEYKRLIQHKAAAKQLAYELDITFSHGRPYFSLTWVLFPGLSPRINAMSINIDLRVREPFRDGRSDVSIPHDHELLHLREDSPDNFAEQLFDYLAILLKIEARGIHTTMQNTLRTNAKTLDAYDAKECSKLCPLIQIGSLQFATEGKVWGEGHNMVLADTDFKWLQF
ncbi:hypothetical protein BDV95DRAFT_627110 [Massariosphaeria phaeospora]|uniref:Uncharacterized protein n=1 Tax=Massariosphaeria phaeospora TaxID=100035 RepID=A0A7C8IA32_9PLEO|nr:hypothetical protein BDV95DRAFT_627110 [Massariosphaeria phaeospora]